MICLSYTNSSAIPSGVFSITKHVKSTEHETGLAKLSPLIINYLSIDDKPNAWAWLTDSAIDATRVRMSCTYLYITPLLNTSTCTMYLSQALSNSLIRVSRTLPMIKRRFECAEFIILVRFAPKLYFEFKL